MSALPMDTSPVSRRGREAHPEAGGGLVTYKTIAESSAQTHISFAKPIVAERRVKRLKRSVWASGHLHGIAQHGHRPPVCWFVTLTYRGVKDWVANHIGQALKSFRNWCASKGTKPRYTWVAELQSRGAVHYHLLVWLPQGQRMPMWDKPTRKAGGRERPAFWPHGMTNTQVAKSGVGYLMKYLSKLGELTIFPKGLRLYGIGGLDDQARQTRSWFSLPSWAQLTHGVGELCRKSCGLVVRLTGEILPPAYSVRHVPGGLVLSALRELPEKFHSGAYSTFPRATA